MALKLIRSDGQFVNAYEDAVGFDFAFNGQSGVIKNILNEFGYDSATVNQFRIKSGHGVIHGRQFINDSEVVLPLMVGNYYYIVYTEIDMSASIMVGERQLKGSIEFKTDYAVNAFPAFPDSDDLNAMPGGVARLSLYRFRQTATGVAEKSVERVFEFVDSKSPSLNIPALRAGYVIPENSIPTNIIGTIVNLTGNGTTVVQQSGTLSSGWYEVELAGGGGGRNSTGDFGGAAGGYLKSHFYVPYNVYYKIMAGGAGQNATGNGGGGGGGGSVLDIAQLGILFIATGGGGFGNNVYGGGGGGGYGGGGGGTGVGGRGGAGGGNIGGGYIGNYQISVSGSVTPSDFGGDGAGAGGGTGGENGGTGGGAGGNGGYGSNNSKETAGGNNINTTTGGGAALATNGYARLYKLGD